MVDKADTARVAERLLSEICGAFDKRSYRAFSRLARAAPTYDIWTVVGKAMDAAVSWLVITGPIVIGAALAIWFGSSRTLGLWTGFTGVLLLLLAGSLQWQKAIWQSQASEHPTQRRANVGPASTQPVRGPTLEATNKSKIDATGAEIPGDLPFQFGRAEKNSLIDMPGIKVTKTDREYTITSEKVNRQFPAPTGEFAPCWCQN